MEGKKVLIVEDKQNTPNTLRVGLTENGFDIEVAYDGNAGYRLFQSNKFHLIVLDMNLSDLNGYEFCKKVRSDNMEIPYNACSS